MRLSAIPIVVVLLAAVAVAVHGFDETAATTATTMLPADDPDLVTIELDVRVPSTGSPLLVASDAEEIGVKSTAVFKKQRTVPGDLVCAVKVAIKGGQVSQYAIGPLGTSLGVVVNSGAAFTALFSDVAGIPAEDNRWHVRVVDEISWCNTYVPAGGCANLNSRRIAVARRKPLVEGVLWAHEIGHTQGLEHRDDSPVALMQPVIRPDHKHLTGSECDAFRK